MELKIRKKKEKSEKRKKEAVNLARKKQKPKEKKWKADSSLIFDSFTVWKRLKKKKEKLYI